MIFHSRRILTALLLGFYALPATESRAGTLTGTFSSVAAGANVNLTTEGKLDWVHWGLYTANSLDRKASVTPQISNFTLIGNSNYFLTAYQYVDNSNGYTWYDGAPTAVVTNSTTGVWAYQSGDPVGSGFELTVPADTNQRTLLVYVGAYQAEGRFTASLSDGSATGFTNASNATVNNTGNGPGGVFAISYSADSSNQSLTITWTLSRFFGNVTASPNVTLQAATLTASNADNPPFVAITAPTNDASFPEPAGITLNADAQDFDGTVTNVSFYAGTNLLGETAVSPYSFTWANVNRGSYTVTALATENGGATGRSQPVDIFVYGTGGGQTNSVATPPSTVDLTTEGTADWTHWGLTTNTSFDYKGTVPRQISNFNEVGTNVVQQYSDNYTAFSWSDGVPTASQSGTTTGVFVTGVTNGFRLTAPADGTSRRLRIYVGGYGVQGEFQAWLSDLSAPPYIDTSVSNAYGNSYAVYTIDYTAASDGQQLIVIYHSLNLFDQIYGNVTLQSATLQGSTSRTNEPPTITTPPSPQTVQCGSNAVFSVSASGTAPLNYQWSLDGAAIPGATTTNLLLSDVHMPNHVVTVVVTNLYGAATDSVTLTVQDTLAPTITLNGSNPFYLELGDAYAEPGGSAYDSCAGVVPVSIGGTVNTNSVGTNFIAYSATDGNGNTDMVTRAVIVRDTTPPAIQWSFTNLELAADTNCSVLMPDVTGTNYIQATDVSEPLTISQSPTNGSVLPVGTTGVLLTVRDAYGNAAYSTNTVTIRDETPPVIWTQPISQTNDAETEASFNVVAIACTPLSYQWYFHNTPLAGQTGSILTVSNLNSTLAGEYFAVATAAGGSTTSAVAALTVTRLTPALVLASSENPAGFKADLNFRAVVTPTNAIGSIQFFTNGVASDLASLTAGFANSGTNNSLPRGTNAVTAIYSGDPFFLPATNTLMQIVTNHPPVAQPFATNRYAGYPLYIPVTDLSSSWNDVDGDSVSLAGVDVSTNGVTVTNEAGTLVYVNSNNVADAFVCILSDGWGGTNYQTITVAVVPQPGDATPVITGVSDSKNGTLHLDMAGAFGSTYVLEMNTNLNVYDGWLPIVTNTLGTNGVWQFSTSMDSPKKFYRFKLAP